MTDELNFQCLTHGKKCLGCSIRFRERISQLEKEVAEKDRLLARARNMLFNISTFPDFKSHYGELTCKTIYELISQFPEPKTEDKK